MEAWESKWLVWRVAGPALVLLLILTAIVFSQVGSWRSPTVPFLSWSRGSPQYRQPAQLLRVPAPAPPHRRLPAAEAAVNLPQGDSASYLALCIAAKDEHCDIREWALHHASLGVRKIYLFDTESEPPMKAVLDDLIAAGLVEYHYLTANTTVIDLKPPPPGRSFHWQAPIYRLCLREYGPRHTWMGFIDADEFVVMQDGSGGSSSSESSRSGGSSESSSGGNNSGAVLTTGTAAAGAVAVAAAWPLPRLLSRYVEYGGLALHWRFFSSNGYTLRPPDGVLQSYTACGGLSTMVKSFVQPKYVRAMQTVHSFAYIRDGQGKKWHAVNTARRPVSMPSVKKGQESGEGAVLHHYFTRSLADFEVKMRRRAGDGSQKTLANFLQSYRDTAYKCMEAVPLGRALAQQYDLQRHVPRRCLSWQRGCSAAGGSSSSSRQGCGTEAASTDRRGPLSARRRVAA